MVVCRCVNGVGIAWTTEGDAEAKLPQWRIQKLAWMDGWVALLLETTRGAHDKQQQRLAGSHRLWWMMMMPFAMVGLFCLRSPCCMHAAAIGYCRWIEIDSGVAHHARQAAWSSNVLLPIDRPGRQMQSESVHACCHHGTWSGSHHLLPDVPSLFPWYCWLNSSGIVLQRFFFFFWLATVHTPFLCNVFSSPPFYRVVFSNINSFWTKL